MSHKAKVSPHSDQVFDTNEQSMMNELTQLLEIDHNSIREERFVRGVFCPFCFGNSRKKISDYVKYGYVNGTKWQRYKCNQCNKVYSDLTGTFFHRSRNVSKWPVFIRLLMVDKLPLKQIAAKLELHTNTIYAWHKKLATFSSQFLPNRHIESLDQHAHHIGSFPINSMNRGAISNNAEEHVNPASEMYITLAIHREDPNQVLAYSSRDKHSIRNDARPTEVMNQAIADFQMYYSKKRGAPSRNIGTHLTIFRMIKLSSALNPRILPQEMFKILLDKDNLWGSKRLLKRLI